MSIVQAKSMGARSVLAGTNLRLIAFTFLASLFGLASLFIMEGLTEGLLPWVTLGCPGCPDGVAWHIEQQRWHGAEHGAMLGLLFGGSLFAMLWRARQKPLVLQFYLLGHTVLVLGYLQRQLSGFGGEHASEARWAGALIMIVCLLLAGLLASTRRPGWQTLGTIVSLTYLYLGVAALSVPDQPGSWGIAGGAASIVAAVAYLVATATEARRASAGRIG